MLVELRIVVHGDVQGVGFRATAKRDADLLKLTGYASNLPDGSVEMCAQGEKVVLEKWLNQLQAKFDIRKLDVSYRQLQERFSAFEIRC